MPVYLPSCLSQKMYVRAVLYMQKKTELVQSHFSGEKGIKLSVYTTLSYSRHVKEIKLQFLLMYRQCRVFCCDTTVIVYIVIALTFFLTLQERPWNVLFKSEQYSLNLHFWPSCSGRLWIRFGWLLGMPCSVIINRSRD